MKNKLISAFFVQICTLIFLATYYVYLVEVNAFESTHINWLLLFLFSLPGSLLVFPGASLLNEFIILPQKSVFLTIWLSLISQVINAIIIFLWLKNCKQQYPKQCR